MDGHGLEDEEVEGRRQLRCLPIMGRINKQPQAGPSGPQRGRVRPWWNSGVSPVSHALPKAFFDRLRLVSMFDTRRHLQRHS